jgi:microcystin-dependent protein
MEEYLGNIKLFAGTYCPQYYMYCDGQTLSIQQYTALFSVLGTQYGGDGRVTFCLPNLNKTPIAAGTSLKYTICTQGLYPARPD